MTAYGAHPTKPAPTGPAWPYHARVNPVPAATTSPAPAPPFAGLNPDTVLDALSAAGWHGDGRLLQLNSYENRVFQVHLEDGRVAVAKFYRPGRWSDAQILEEHAFSLDLAEADLPVLAPWALPQPGADPRLQVQAPAASPNEDAPPRPATLGHYQGDDGRTWRFAVTDRRVGRAPELEDPQVLARIGRLLARLHRVGRQGRFLHRRTLSVASYGMAARDQLLASGLVHPDTEGPWLQASAQALALAQQCLDAQGPMHTLRLHGDCHVNNLIWRAEGEHPGPSLVDFDDCCTGPAIQDLWMLLPGEREAVEVALYRLLDGYRDVLDFDDRELALIEPLRTLRMVHHSAWLAQRWADPAFPAAFPWFASPAYWQQQTTELREQIERMAA